MARRIGQQVVVISTLSIALGFAFNASNPIGIRLTTAAPPATTPTAASSASAANTPAPPSSSPLVPVSTTSSATPAPVLDTPAGVTATVTHWPQVKPLLAAGEIVLVDARPESTYEAGHIPGAISLPFTAGPDAYSAFRAQQPTSAHLVVYCGSTSCSLSKQLAEKLIAEFGYYKVEYMTGGYQEWQQAELGGSATTAAAVPPVPAFASPQAPEPGIAPAAAVPSPILPPSTTADQIPILSTPTTWDAVKPLMQSGQVVMVDARPKTQFAAGHIPGAVSLPFTTGPEDYENFIKEHSPYQHLVIYCSSTSCSLAKRLADKLAKEHGFKRVQFMTGGYQEWQKAELTQTKAGS